MVVLFLIGSRCVRLRCRLCFWWLWNLMVFRVFSVGWVLLVRFGWLSLVRCWCSLVLCSLLLNRLCVLWLVSRICFCGL